jgi:hypothetical protein
MRPSITTKCLTPPVFRPIFAGRTVDPLVRRELWWDGKAWNADDHPRDARGRFIGVSADRAAEIRQQLEQTRGTADPKEVAATLSQMTTKQLRELKAQLGVKGGKTKGDLAAKVATAALAKAKLRDFQELEKLTTEPNKWGTQPGQGGGKTEAELKWEALDAEQRKAGEEWRAKQEAESQARQAKAQEDAKAWADRLAEKYGIGDEVEEETIYA